MAFPNRLYSKNERGHFVYDQYKGFHKFNQYFYLRTGVIEDVDPEKYEMTVRWTDNTGVHTKVPISFAFSSPAACMGALPEKGSIGIFQFFNEGTGKGRPLLLSYLPSGLNAGMCGNVVKISPDSISTDDINEILFKHRKLNPGDMIMSSALGSTLFLNNSSELHDSIQDTFQIREDDQSILATSLNNFVFADGVSVCIGPALRNSLKLYDDQTGKRLDTNGGLLPLLIGKDNVYITPHGEDIEYGTPRYAEYRIDVDEYGYGKVDMNDINSSSPLSTRDPIVTMSLGNYIGADRRNDKLYGNLLKVLLFKSADDKKGCFSLERARQNNGVDEPSILGLAYAMHLKNGSFLGMDKEGHYYMHLLGSKANPLGPGRSMSILAEGNLKEIWGQTTTDSNSWDLKAKGGVIWDIGAHNAKRYGRSLDITTSKGISITVNDADDDGFAKIETLQGNVQEIITKDKIATCNNLTHYINGMKTENISGSSFESVQATKSVSCADYSENVINLRQAKIGKRKTTITMGNDELTLMKGSILETLTFGKRSTKVVAGDALSKGVAIEENITTGHRVTEIGLGNYTVSVKAGMIKIGTKAGMVSISGNTVNISGTLVTNLKAPMVKMGSNPVKGGMIVGLPGVPSHFDYMTGVPHKGSMTVSATA